MSTKRPIPDFSCNSATRTAWEWIVIMLLAIVIVPVVIAVAMSFLPFAIVGGAIYGGVRLYRYRAERGW